MRKLTLAMAFMAVTLCTAVQAAELKEEFSYGLNYAWKNYSGDFGGISAWGLNGVASDPDTYRAELQDMADNGVKVVRWWIWPEFWTEAINFSEDGTPNQLGQAAIDDGLKALELADEVGVRLMLCLFSFDGFRPTRETFGITMTGYHDIVIDDSKRGALMKNVVTPFARALQSSPYIDSLHSWDVINEPEWATTGPNKFGGNDFEPDDELQAITHDQMETFIADTLNVLRTETPDIPLSVGAAALKWITAWSALDVDFYQTHIYDWVNEYWPYSKSPADYGLDDKPLIMGEYPVEGLDGADHETMLQSWYSNGYAGALGWDYRITHASGISGAALTTTRNKYLTELDNFASQSIDPADMAVDNNATAEPTDPDPETETELESGAAKRVPLTAPGRPGLEVIDK